MCQWVLYYINRLLFLKNGIKLSSHEPYFAISFTKWLNHQMQWTEKPIKWKRRESKQNVSVLISGLEPNSLDS